MATVIGIFDNSPTVENAVGQLNEKGLTQEVFDPSLELVQSIGVGSALGADVAGMSPRSGLECGGGECDRDYFRASLSDLKVPDEAIQYYETVFERGDIFIVVETEDRFVDAAMDVMRTSGASQIGHHG